MMRRCGSMLTRISLVVAALLMLATGNVQQVLAAPATPPDTTNDTAPTDPYYYTQNNIIFYGVGGDCDAAVGDLTGQGITGNKDQMDNAKTIIGIVKAYNLPQTAAVIAVMVGLDESGLHNLANPSVPISESNPNKQGDGADHDSVGVFQQRPSSGWSTFGNGDSKDIVWQLMDVAYSAQAFLGTPPGAQLPSGLVQPSALKKGLQNVDGWQSLQPWVAAQRVQISGDPTGENYHKEYGPATSLVQANWATTQAIKLPISITGGAVTPGTTDAGSCANSAVTGNLMQTVVKYAWPTYHDPNYFNMMPDYAKAVADAQAKNEYVGGPPPGIDCGGFITLLMRNSGTDPQYNAYQGGTVAQQKYMDDHPEKYQKLPNITGVGDPNKGGLQPGDIAINSEHTYMYVGKLPGFSGNSASASQSERAPMASPAYDFSNFSWYRLIKK